MKTKKTINCRMFTNFIVTLLCCHFLTESPNISTVQIDGDLVAFEFDLKKVEERVAGASTNVVTTVTVTKQNVQSGNAIPYKKPSYNAVTGANLVNYAKYYLGLPYVSTGYSLSTGTDCSGFTKLIFQEFGITIGRTVKSQLYSGQYVSKSDLKPGDLVFYGHSSNYATHVGIYIGNGLVIHESNPRDGVKISSVNMMVYITARRLITESVSKEVDLPNENKNESKNESSNDTPLEKEEIKEENSNSATKDEVKPEVKDETKEEVKVDNEKQEVDESKKEEKEEINSSDENIVVEEENSNTKEEIVENTSIEKESTSIKEESKTTVESENKININLESDTSK